MAESRPLPAGAGSHRLEAKLMAGTMRQAGRGPGGISARGSGGLSPRASLRP